MVCYVTTVHYNTASIFFFIPVPVPTSIYSSLSPAKPSHLPLDYRKHFVYISLISSTVNHLFRFIIISHSNSEQQISHFHHKVKNLILLISCHSCFCLHCIRITWGPNAFQLGLCLSSLLLLIANHVSLCAAWCSPTLRPLWLTPPFSPLLISMCRRESQLLPHCSGWGQALRNRERMSHRTSTHLC